MAKAPPSQRFKLKKKEVSAVNSLNNISTNKLDNDINIGQHDTSLVSSFEIKSHRSFCMFII